MRHPCCLQLPSVRLTLIKASPPPRACAAVADDDDDDEDDVQDFLAAYAVDEDDVKDCSDGAGSGSQDQLKDQCAKAAPHPSPSGPLKPSSAPSHADSGATGAAAPAAVAPAPLPAAEGRHAPPPTLYDDSQVNVQEQQVLQVSNPRCAWQERLCCHGRYCLQHACMHDFALCRHRPAACKCSCHVHGQLFDCLMLTSLLLAYYNFHAPKRINSLFTAPTPVAIITPR